ncbi:MAG: Uma2 family endonuclease [Scytolyngbya sp. HA4215-MV1]|jgi:Uma2 family endonuclease|nr:Uma2 family endonuclease [Scytolyngbya sp. HA4215-MV1]
MATILSNAMTLQEFLQLSETEPASEYIDGQIIQKPMPKGKHSRLQLRLCDQINQQAESQKIASAFPELRCNFGTRSIVPDVAIFKWERIPFDAAGEVPDDFFLPPDWVIEILSPEQSSNRVIGNILYCLEDGCQLGWLIDPSDRSILIFHPNQQPKLLKDDDVLAVLPDVSLTITVAVVFNFLKMAG